MNKEEEGFSSAWGQTMHEVTKLSQNNLFFFTVHVLASFLGPT